MCFLNAALGCVRAMSPVPIPDPVLPIAELRTCFVLLSNACAEMRRAVTPRTASTGSPTRPVLSRQLDLSVLSVLPPFRFCAPLCFLVDALWLVLVFSVPRAFDVCPFSNDVSCLAVAATASSGTTLYAYNGQGYAFTVGRLIGAFSCPSLCRARVWPPALSLVLLVWCVMRALSSACSEVPYRLSPCPQFCF